MNKAAVISILKNVAFIVGAVIAVRTIAGFVPLAGPLVLNAMDNSAAGLFSRTLQAFFGPPSVK